MKKVITKIHVGDVLAICLSRAGIGAVKDKTQFDVGAKLNVNFGQRKPGKQESIFSPTGMFRLVAAIYHLGETSSSGHYVCITAPTSCQKKWLCDDEKIVEHEQWNVDGATPYILFYKSIGAKW